MGKEKLQLMLLKYKGSYEKNLMIWNAKLLNQEIWIWISDLPLLSFLNLESANLTFQNVNIFIQIVGRTVSIILR